MTEPGAGTGALVDLRAYTNRLRQLVRDDPLAGSTRWRPLFEEGLRQAFLQRDPVGVSQIIEFAAGLFDAAGYKDEALNEIDHGLAIAGNDPDVKVLLHGMRASLLAGLGRIEEAAVDLAEVRAHCPAAQHPFVRFHGEVDHLAIACRLLSKVDEAEAGRLLARATDGEADILFLLSWFVPYLFATGDAKRTHPWTRTLRVKAELVPHRWREADAIAFETAERAARGVEADGPSSWPDDRNWLARWRVTLLGLHAAVTRRALATADGQLDALAIVMTRAGKTDLGGIAPFRAYVEALSDPISTVVALEPPASVHLGNLAATFAAAQAVACGGSRAHAASWLGWFDSALPGHIVTCCEWPVSRWRVEACLAARSGDLRRSRRLFERAIAWATESGYALERGVAQVQFAELAAHGRLLVRESAWKAIRRDGWECLRDLGVEPLAFAYEVPTSLAVACGEASPDVLTPREVEVFECLAHGLTYRAAAEQLGIRTPTVQTLAHRVYEKLDVHNRHDAVERGRELGIL